MSALYHLWILLLGLTAVPALGAAPGWAAARWSIEDGLPLAHINKVAQTRDGLIWLATYDGLVRFDGTAFTVYRSAANPGIPSDRIIDLHATADGALWLLTEDGQLSRHRGGDFQAHALRGRGRAFAPGVGTDWLITDGGLMRWEDGAPVLWRPDAITRTAVATAGGALWSGDHLGGLLKIPPAGVVEHLEFDGALVNRLHSDRDGILWAATHSGLFRLRDGDFEAIRWDDRMPSICGLAEDAGGTLWVRGRRGWGWVEGDHVTTERLGESGECGHTEVRAASDDRGLWRLHADTLLLDEQVILEADATLTSLLPDRTGGVWVGTLGDGLYRVRPTALSAVGVAEGLPGDNIRSVSTDGGDGVWVVTAEGADAALWSGGGVTGRITLDGASLYSVLQAPDGDVWLSRENAIYRAEGEDITLLPPQRPGSRGANAHGLHWYDGGVVAPSERGVFLWRPEAARWEELTGPDGERFREGRAALTTPDGALLVGSATDGLLRVAPGGDREQTSSVVARVRGLTGGDGVIWMGTEGRGLCRLSPMTGPLADAAIACLGWSQGLPADTIHTAIEDDLGRLWMSTNQGLAVARTRDVMAVLDGDARSLQLLTLDERDGMRDREANGTHHPSVARTADGRLWFPTQGGLVSVAPAELELPSPPMVFLESVTISGEAAALQPHLALSPEQRDVTVSWIAPEYSWPDQVRFRFRLLGYNDTWSQPSSERKATWTNLPPGDLTVQIQAGLAGRWGPASTLQLRRRPAFSETAWYPFSLALMAAAALGGGFWTRLRQVHRRQEVLEATVAARTAELADKNLRLVEKARELEERSEQIREQAARLREVDTLKTRFVANISHELRTPISLVTGPLADAVAAPDALAPEQRRQLDRALRNAERLQSLIEQMLDVARLDDDGIPLRARRQELGAFARRVCERFDDRARQQGLSLTVETPPDAIYGYFDPDLIDKVITNLVGNALKFTASGGVRVRLEPAPPAASFARLHVLDTGPGVPEETRGRLFERFYQVDSSATRGHGGAGIGLALASELIALHGGEISVDAADGGGSDFWFTLPLGADHLRPEEIDTSPTKAPPEAHAPLPEVAPSTLEGDRPLVVLAEDHPDMRAYLAEHLQRRFDVIAVADGEAALAAALLKRPAAVVSDVMMPRMDGLSLCRRLRADPALASVPVMLVSAKAREDDRVTGLEIADDYLTKPFQIRELMARVQRLVQRGAGPDAPTPEQAPAIDEGPALSVADAAFLERLERVADGNLPSAGFGVAELSKKLGFSSRQLQREVGRLTGTTPKGYLRERRMIMAQSLLKSGRWPSVAEVARAVGMSPSYFSRVYATWAGRAPSRDLAS